MLRMEQLGSEQKDSLIRQAENYHQGFAASFVKGNDGEDRGIDLTPINSLNPEQLEALQGRAARYALEKTIQVG